jgi:hypothetical protein
MKNNKYNNFLPTLYLKTLRYLYPKYGLNESDIILATFPRSGTTWFRFIWSNIISILDLKGVEVDYKILNEKLNCSYDNNYKPKVEFKSLPLLRSTHKEFNKNYFSHNKSIYIYRNPADTMVSYFLFRKSLVNDEYKYSFKKFIRDEKYGIKKWISHFTDWKKHATVILRYEDLRKNTFQNFKNVLNQLQIYNIEDDVIKLSIKKSNINNIQRIETEKGKDRKAQLKHKTSFKFARSGEINQWPKYFNKDDLEYMIQILENNKQDEIARIYK